MADNNQTPKSKARQSAIAPTRAQDFPEWYQQVVKAADMADNSDVRGCMVIKPWGYGIWEQMQKELDRRIKATGHKNAYFPMLIPLNYLAKEAKHIDGFAKECAVVTHHRLVGDGEGGLKPDGELTEPFIIRPTSETIIGASFSKWVNSYRELPLLINQWANVMRWEMRPRVFLRTSEFLWQEGHTAHETKEEAEEETAKMFEQYKEFAREFLAIPTYSGPKPESERFPGAEETYTFEGMMQDTKALQMGTSHFLGQTFSKAYNIEFVSRENKKEYAWTTSWGVSTRMVGAVIMAHSDDNGLVLPPALAPTQIVIVPILKPGKEDEVMAAVHALKAKLEAQTAFGNALRVDIDDRDIGGGAKGWEHIKKGVPLRVEIGPRDVESGNLVYFDRTSEDVGQKNFMAQDEFAAKAAEMLVAIRDALYARAEKFLNDNTVEVRTPEELEAHFKACKAEGRKVGFVLTPWEGFEKYEEAFSEEYKVTVRCHPMERQVDGKKSAIWAQSY